MLKRLFGLDWLAKKLGYVEQDVRTLRRDFTDLVGRVQQFEERIADGAPVLTPAKPRCAACRHPADAHREVGCIGDFTACGCLAYTAPEQQKPPLCKHPMSRLGADGCRDCGESMAEIASVWCDAPEALRTAPARHSLLTLALAPDNHKATMRVVSGQAYRKARHSGDLKPLREALGIRQDHRTAERCIKLDDPERDEVLLVFEGFEDDDLEDAPPVDEARLSDLRRKMP